MLSMTQVQNQIGEDLHEILVAGHVGAFKRLEDITKAYPAAIAALNATERANFLHGQIRQLIAAGVETHDGAQITDWDIDTVAVGVNLLVRFKYLGHGTPANNRSTEQQRLLERQQYKQTAMALLVLAGIEEPPTIVTCGYTLDGLQLSRVLIQRDCTGHDRWNYDIYGGTAVMEPLALPGIAEVTPGVVVRSAQEVADEAAWREAQARRAVQSDD
jgi:hypothetical protein